MAPIWHLIFQGSARESLMNFEIGDVVELTAGGPEMTIEEWRPQTQRYKCTWFSGSKKEVGYFPPATLKKVEGK